MGGFILSRNSTLPAQQIEYFPIYYLPLFSKPQTVVTRQYREQKEQSRVADRDEGIRRAPQCCVHFYLRPLERRVLLDAVALGTLGRSGAAAGVEGVRFQFERSPREAGIETNLRGPI